MRTHWQIALLLAMAIATPLTANADIIQLQNGQTISGSMKRIGNQMVITADDGTTTHAKPEDIAGVTLTATPDEQAAVVWSTFKSDVARADDLAAVLSLHTQFLAANPQSPNIGEVKESLANYQQLAQQNPVKFRGRWMPSAQVPVLLQQWKDDAAPSLAAYHGGNMNASLNAARQALAKDAQNPDALEIAGLAAMHMDLLGEAQLHFQQLANTAPGTGLAWHNLAVIDLLQARQAQALPLFSKALQAMPANRLLLDNIAGLLGAYIGETNTPAYQSLVRQFTQAESREEPAMAAEGLYRYGSTWLSQSLLTQYSARDAQLAAAVQNAEQISNESLDPASSARLAQYEQQLQAAAQSARAFVPRLMDLGEDQIPPAPTILAGPAPLPNPPIITAPPPDTTQDTSIANNNDSWQPADADNATTPGIVFSPGRNGWRNPARNTPRQDPPPPPPAPAPVQRTAPAESAVSREIVPPPVAPVQFNPAPPSTGGGSLENSPLHK